MGEVDQRFETIKALSEQRIKLIKEFTEQAESKGDVMQLQALVMRRDEALRKIADLAEDIKKTHDNHLQQGTADEKHCVAAWGLEKILSVARRELERGE
jgi:hypothetical protein